MVGHKRAIASISCFAFFKKRGGPKVALGVDYNRPFRFGKIETTLLPSGFSIGSAQILVRFGTATLLYTGRFSLDASPFSPNEAFVPGSADVLVMEVPEILVTPDGTTIHGANNTILEATRTTLQSGATPVVLIERWRSKEMTSLLHRAGMTVMLHRSLVRAHRATANTTGLGRPLTYRGKLLPQTVLVWPIDLSHSRALRALGTRHKMHAILVWDTSENVEILYPSRLHIPVAANIVLDQTRIEDLMGYINRCRPRQIYLTGPGADAALPFIEKTGIPTNLAKQFEQLSLL